MTSFHANARTATVLIATVLLIGCPMKAKVAVRDESTIANLSFVVSGGFLGGATELPMFAVESCAAAFSGPATDYWRIEATPQATSLKVLGFGITPAGYSTLVTAKSLSPGSCYAVAYGGTDDMYFVTDAAGRAQTISREDAQRRALTK